MILILIVFQTIFAFADTPPVTSVKSKTLDGAGAPITSTTTGPKTALDVNVVGGGGSTTVNQGLKGTSPEAWYVQGSLGRTWSLLNTTDSVNVGNFPSTYAVVQSTSPWVVSGTVNSIQSGAWTAGRTWSLLNTTDSVNVGNFPATFGVTQSTSPWVTSVNNFPSTFGVTQSTSPWVVSGTVTSNIGTTNGLALDATVAETHGSAAGGTAAAKSGLGAGLYNTAPPTLTNGQQAALQLDSSGNLKTTSSGTSTVTQGTTPWVDNVSQFGGSNVVTGTGISGAGIPRVTVSSDSSVQSVQSGTWNQRLQDGSGNAITSQTSGAQRALDVGIDVAGVQVDPRTRTWSLLSGTDSVSSIQSGSWTTGRTWSLLNTTDSVNSVQSGSWTTGRTWSLLNTTDSVNVGNFPSTYAVTQSTSPWVISGTVTANAGTGNFTVVQATGTNLHAVLDTTSTTAVTQATAANLNATVVQSSGANLHVNVDSAPTTTVTGTVTANIGTTNGLALDATLTGGTARTKVTDGTNNAAVKAASTAALATDPALVVAVSPNNSVAVTGPLTDTQLRASSVPVTATGSGNFTVVQPTGTNLHAVLDTTSTTAVTQATAANLNATVVQASGANLHVNVDSAPTTTVTGTVTANAGTNLNTSALALSATQTDGTQKTKIVDGSNNTVGPVTTLSAVNYMPVVLASSATPGAAAVARSIQIAGSDGTNAQTIKVDTNGNLVTVQKDSTLATYSACATNLAAAATPTDVATLAGSGTKTIKVLRVSFAGTENTLASRDVRLIKRSTADTGGTSAALTAVSHDSNNAAATASALSYTANPTLGTTVGTFRAEQKNISTGGGANATVSTVWQFGNNQDQSIALRGTAQQIAVNLNSVTAAGNALDICFDWTEE